MPEMLAARSDRDFIAVSPQQRRRAPGAAGARLARVARTILTHPGEVLAALLLAGASAAITVNALGLQTARHPAPLFTGARDAPIPVPPVRPVAVAAPAALPAVAAPVPPARAPVQQGSLAELIRSEGSLAPRAAAEAAKPRDVIGELIRTGEPPRTAPAAAEPRIAAAQRALSKLGYGPLKVDGVMGTETRQAIERFEKDRKLAVTGELGARTARELVARAGVPLD